jgi:hypothetical protein
MRQPGKEVARRMEIYKLTAAELKAFLEAKVGKTIYHPKDTGYLPFYAETLLEEKTGSIMVAVDEGWLYLLDEGALNEFLQREGG